MLKPNEKIEVYKDQILLKLIGRWANLVTEETGFLLDNNEMGGEGRSMRDVASDMIDVYKETNTHLINRYPGNKIAESWIATNEFGVKILTERWVQETYTKTAFFEPEDTNHIKVNPNDINVIS